MWADVLLISDQNQLNKSASCNQPRKWQTLQGSPLLHVLARLVSCLFFFLHEYVYEQLITGDQQRNLWWSIILLKEARHSNPNFLYQQQSQCKATSRTWTTFLHNLSKIYGCTLYKHLLCFAKDFGRARDCEVVFSLFSRFHILACSGPAPPPALEQSTRNEQLSENECTEKARCKLTGMQETFRAFRTKIRPTKPLCWHTHIFTIYRHREIHFKVLNICSPWAVQPCCSELGWWGVSGVWLGSLGGIGVGSGSSVSIDFVLDLKTATSHELDWMNEFSAVFVTYLPHHGNNHALLPNPW